MSKPCRPGSASGDPATVSPEVSPDPCACGCGEPVRAGARWRKGHNFRGRTSPTPASWKAGQTSPNLRHGLRTREPTVEDVEPVLGAVIADLAAKVPEPLVDEEGRVLPWAQESLWTLGILKLGLTRCLRYLASHGETDERGRWRPENDSLAKATERYRRALGEEAMTLKSRLDAGLTLARTTDLSSALSEPDPARRARALDALGLPEDEDEEEDDDA